MQTYFSILKQEIKTESYLHLKKCRIISTQILTADINIHKFFSALLGLYAYTGCDTVSAFAGKGKLKAMKLLVAETEYIDLLCKVGKSMELDEEMFSKLEEFTCHLYVT